MKKKAKSKDNNGAEIEIDFNELVMQILRENLSIQVSNESANYETNKCIRVRLCLGNKEISSDSFYV